MLTTLDQDIDRLRKRFYVDWVNVDGDLEVTQFWATSPDEALDQARASLRLKWGERILGVTDDWDAVIVDGEPVLRHEWEARRQTEYVIAMGEALFPSREAA